MQNLFLFSKLQEGTSLSFLSRLLWLIMKTFIFKVRLWNFISYINSRPIEQNFIDRSGERDKNVI